MARVVFPPRLRRAACPATLLITGLAYAAGQGVWPSFQAYPFFFYFPAIILTAVLFGDGAGYLFVRLSGVILLFDLEPRRSILVFN